MLRLVSIHLQEVVAVILTRAAEVIGRKVVGCLERAVVDEPSVAQRTIRDVCDAQLTGSLNQPIRLVHRLEGRVLGLERVNLGDCDLSVN